MATGLVTPGVSPSRVPFDESERVPTPNAADQRPLLDERRRDPAQAQDDFWGYLDARDVGTAFVAAAQGASRGHEVFLMAAADSNADRSLRELMAEYYDGYDAVDPDLPDEASAFDCSKMERVFGWQAQHSWRDGS